MANEDSPTHERDTEDRGDDTLSRFRYQAAYGVSLLVKAAAAELDYKAIWCEQWEDFLAEVNEDLFDAIQVKTRNEEEGYWKVGDTSLKKAIHRFAKLQEKFDGKIRRFTFVSNMNVERRGSHASHSPQLLVDSIQKAESHEDLSGTAKVAFEKLATDCPTDRKTLFEALMKTTFQRGPSKEGYESILAHSVLPKLNEASNLGAPALDNLRDEMIAKVSDASSLAGTDGSEYWTALGGNVTGDSALRKKRISIEAFHILVTSSIEQPFRYLDSGLNPGFSSEAEQKLRTKLEDGDLSHQVAQMKSRALAANQRMQELSLLKPKEFAKIWDQIVGVVHAECSEAFLNNKTDSGFFGEAMMRDVLNRLEKIEQETPNKVFGESRELLVGTAGILTGECAVGWSKKYPIREIGKS